MNRSIILSSIGHIVVLVAVYIGVPRFFSPDPPTERVIVVDLVPIAEQRNLPKRAAPKPEPEPEPEVESEPPPPTPPEAEAAPPPPEPKVEVAAAEPEPVPTPVEAPPELAETARLPDTIARPKQKPKPPPQDQFASLLKSIEELEDDLPRPRPDAEPVETAAIDPVEAILAETDSGFDDTQPLSMSEIDSIRYQIQRNWAIPAGARDAQNLLVTLRIQLGRDGKITGVSVVDAARMERDPFFRTMAESTVRAVRRTGQIKNLSPQKYHLWRDMQINFDPREMFG